MRNSKAVVYGEELVFVPFAYISYATEVETHGLLQRLLALGKSLAVPRMVTRTDMLAQVLASWDGLVSGPMGILVPQDGPSHPGPFQVAITPGLGFTERGQRLGFGAGYYDRWFAGNPVGCKVALAFEAQLLDDLPTEATDMPVDAIVTERRVIRVG